MLRAIFSALTVFLLAVITFLLYSNYFNQEKSYDRGENANTGDVPALAPLPPIAPPVSEPQDPINKATGPIIKPSVTPEGSIPPTPSQNDTGLVYSLKKTHVVQPGDTLWSISKKYFGTPVYYQKIAGLNRMNKNDRVRTGQVLVLPAMENTAKVINTFEEINEHRIGVEAGTSADDPQPPTLNIVRNKNSE